MLNLLGSEVRADPYPVYAWLRNEQPVARVEPGGIYAVSRYEDVVSVLRNPQAFSSKALHALVTPPWLPPTPALSTPIMMDPPEHTRIRTLMSRAFEPRVIAQLESRIRAIVREDLVDRLGAHEQVDVVTEYSGPLPMRVIVDMLGMDPALLAQFKRWGDALVAVSPVTPPAHHDAIRTAIAEMEGHFRTVIADRRRNPGGDLVSYLVQHEAGTGLALSDEELIGCLALILIAGFETTINLISQSLRVLAARPEDFAALRASPALIPGFVEEVLRYEPPVHGTLRFATGDTVIAGAEIPAGSMVLALLGAALRDERRFSDPERFDMRREPGRSLAFGHGIHFCLGAMLGRLEARVALEEIVKRYDRVTAAPGEITWNHQLTVRGPLALPLRFRRAAHAGTD
jgi:cytochrome P450